MVTLRILLISISMTSSFSSSSGYGANLSWNSRIFFFFLILKGTQIHETLVATILVATTLVATTLVATTLVATTLVTTTPVATNSLTEEGIYAMLSCQLVRKLEQTGVVCSWTLVHFVMELTCTLRGRWSV